MALSLHIQSFDQFQSYTNHALTQNSDFWLQLAENFKWHSFPTQADSGSMQDASIQWFVDGKLNITENCIDRHLPSKATQTAFTWQPNNPDEAAVIISYQTLSEEVNKLANALKSLKIQKGDRVILYMPMIPQAVYAMLACARIGAIHSVVFAGFSAQALADRMLDAEASCVITASTLQRGAKTIALQDIVRVGFEIAHSNLPCIIWNNQNAPNPLLQNEFDYAELIDNQSVICNAESMSAEDPLFILYTSGSTGKPKGVVHTIGGYMVYTAFSFKNVFQYAENDVYWCTADIGWITGHSYIVYAPLLMGAHSILFEGIPTYPKADTFWKLIDKHQVTQFYTAPTVIRSLMVEGTDLLQPYSLNSLKVIGSVGEPINVEAWNWYNTHIGKSKLPIVDTWWQTETGGILISGLGDLSPIQPTYAGLPLPGIECILVDSEGNTVTQADQEGNLCIAKPWPSMVRTTWGNHQRCIDTYFTAYPGYYFTGDGAKRSESGMFRILGRVDDVINVSGHRFGTAEIENVINTHQLVAESAVIGIDHPIKGQGIFAFVIPNSEIPANEVEQRIQEIQLQIETSIGKIAKAERILFCPGLPKTRSGKIMRRILRKLAESQYDQLGDTSTLVDPIIVQTIQKLLS